MTRLRITRTEDCVREILCYQKTLRVEGNKWLNIAFVFKNIERNNYEMRGILNHFLRFWSLELTERQLNMLTNEWRKAIINLQQLATYFTDEGYEFSTFKAGNNADIILYEFSAAMRLDSTLPGNCECNWSNFFY